jgi:hypothetical protein
MTYQGITVLRPPADERVPVALSTPSAPRTGQAPVALSVALRYLASRRMLRRARVIAHAGA